MCLVCSIDQTSERTTSDRIDLKWVGKKVNSHQNNSAKLSRAFTANWTTCHVYEPAITFRWCPWSNSIATWCKLTYVNLWWWLDRKHQNSRRLNQCNFDAMIMMRQKTNNTGDNTHSSQLKIRLISVVVVVFNVVFLSPDLFHSAFCSLSLYHHFTSSLMQMRFAFNVILFYI